MKRTYLDGRTSVELVDGKVKLTTYTGVRITNVILLSPQMYNSLVKWVEQELTRKDQP